MDDSKKQKGNISGTIGMLIGLIGAAAPIITTALEKMPAKSEPRQTAESLVIIPDLYTKGFPLTLEQASEKLSSEGFKVISSKMTLKDAKPKYRECIDMQVVDSRPRSRAKAKPGTTVIVRYITQDVIDESQKTFYEEERRKLEKKAQRTAGRQKQLEQTKQFAAGVINKTKNSAKKMFSRRDRKAKT